jgi:predicted dehydrogenase
MKRAVVLSAMGLLLTLAQSAGVAADHGPGAPVRLITLDPGHFHASLVQKFMYDGVDPLVHVYAPAGNDVAEHLKRIEAFNARPAEPTHWRENVYTGADYLDRMLQDRAGNVVVISGNNARKAEYIARAVDAGMNVLADKPMVITPADFERLKVAFATAAQKGVLIADIMTERFEIATVLQRELSRLPAVFGKLETGSLEQPAITMQSVHYFSKVVAGTQLKRPQWFFDVRQEGEGLLDVGTHLVDLVQWEAFPGQGLQPADAQVLAARCWATPVTREQFQRVTGASDFPEFLRTAMRDGALQVASNGELTYRLRGVFAKVSVSWEYEAPPGGNDTHYSVMRGTRANLVIRQGEAQRFKPVLYVERVKGVSAADLEKSLRAAIAGLQAKYPGVGVRSDGDAWVVTIPEKYDVGHEAHFAQVTENFLAALRTGQLPAWEVPNMLTRYSTLVQAYQMSHSATTTRNAGEWQRTETSLAWLAGGHTVWKLSFDPKTGNKPFFHPLSVAGGPALTWARPDDHPWHYGLWFSWKYINAVNYWEESRDTGLPDGVTRWRVASIDTQPDGRAKIRFDVTYVHPSGRVDLTESRTLDISAPATDGSYIIDWHSTFTAGKEGALLDRTPMPGDPNGQVNGGYAGLGLRTAPDPLTIAFVSSDSPITQFDSNRARPNAHAVAANFKEGDHEAGAIAIVSDSPTSPWYLVNAPKDRMRFLCAAVLAPQPMQLSPGGALQLHYRIAVRREGWTPEALRELTSSN